MYKINNQAISELKKIAQIKASSISKSVYGMWCIRANTAKDALYFTNLLSGLGLKFWVDIDLNFVYFQEGEV